MPVTLFVHSMHMQHSACRLFCCGSAKVARQRARWRLFARTPFRRVAPPHLYAALLHLLQHLYGRELRNAQSLEPRVLRKGQRSILASTMQDRGQISRRRHAGRVDSAEVRILVNVLEISHCRTPKQVCAPSGQRRPAAARHSKDAPRQPHTHTHAVRRPAGGPSLRWPGPPAGRAPQPGAPPS